ncbi:MAG: tRNA pseudouridine(38-40) synthase TruA [Bacteroidota bacterium]
MSLSRYFLEIAYQGTHYHGWQIQQNATTVQGILQTSLARCLGYEVVTVGSGRTDTGVHARQQFAHVDIDNVVDIVRLHYQVNALLPPSIAVTAIHPVQVTAHARFDATSRTYRYAIVPAKNPFLCEITYLFARPLDIETMNQAARLLCGERDFRGFCKAHTAVSHYRCCVMEARWVVELGQLVFYIRANRFLRGMVRFIVSHLLQVGTGKLCVRAFERLLQQNSRNMAAALVPACGLTLAAVSYPDSIFLPRIDIPS